MKDANPRARLSRLITERNYVGAQLFLKQAELEKAERDELLGMLATAVVEELSTARRDDRERVVYLRTILTWILREVPGLSSLYREQLRGASARGGLIPDLGRGVRNFADVASGRKTVEEGISEAADDARRSFEDATERMRSESTGEGVGEFLASAERGIRDGLDQLGAFFRAMNEDAVRPSSQGRDPEPSDQRDTAAGAAARADRSDDVEDVEFEQEINVEREGEGPDQDRPSE